MTGKKSFTPIHNLSQELIWIHYTFTLNAGKVLDIYKKIKIDNWDDKLGLNFRHKNEHLGF